MVEIKLTQEKVTIVDDDTLEEILNQKWCFLKAGYAVARIKNQFVYLHRIITSAKPGEHVDHVNGDKLDNRRANLRIATHKQNMANRKKQVNNRSGFKGVQRNGKKGWMARLKTGGISYYLGTFKTPEDAATAYNFKAIEIFGEFAQLNKTKESLNVKIKFVLLRKHSRIWPTSGLS